jgi:DNA-binding HxlR family transcriptional regulator
VNASRRRDLTSRRYADAKETGRSAGKAIWVADGTGAADRAQRRGRHGEQVPQQRARRARRAAPRAGLEGGSRAARPVRHRWDLAILCNLDEATGCRPADLRATINAQAGPGRQLSPQVLSGRLRELEHDGYSRHEDVLVMPLHRAYYLMPPGQALIRDLAKVIRPGQAAYGVAVGDIRRRRQVRPYGGQPAMPAAGLPASSGFGSLARPGRLTRHDVGAR